jgi:monoamine oxidase
VHSHLWDIPLTAESDPTADMKLDVAVIGGGVGGLISSALLSRSGLKVLLVEKNVKCGGRMNSEYLPHPSVIDATYRYDQSSSNDCYENSSSGSIDSNRDKHNTSSYSDGNNNRDDDQ